MAEIQKHLSNSDLVSIQAPGYKDAHTLMRLYKSEGKKVVVDYDDYSFDLSPGNARYCELGTRETEELGPDGKPAYKWRDMENGFDLKSNQAKYEAFKMCVKDADLVTTTTEYLAEKFRTLNERVVVCPNSVDFNLWKPIPGPDVLKDEVRIGWFGGDSHYVDLKGFKTLLPRVIKRFPQVKIVLQAPPVPQWLEFFKEIPKERIEWHNWADLRYYPLFLASRHFDIGLCPLEDNEFNKCKSSIKFFEFTAIGATTIAQNMHPYSQNIIHGDTGFLASTEDEWMDCIAELVENTVLRKHMAKNAYDYVYENFNIKKNCRIWEQAYMKCLNS